MRAVAAQVERWPHSSGKSPREQALKERIRNALTA